MTDIKEEKKVFAAKFLAYNMDPIRPDQFPAVWTKIKEYIAREKPLVFGLSETKRKKEELVKLFSEASELQDYVYIINSHIPSHSHGVAMLIRKDVSFRQMDAKLGCEARADTMHPFKDATCGRLIVIEIDLVKTRAALGFGEKPAAAEQGKLKRIRLANVYVPNSGTNPKHLLKYLEYRIHKWDESLFALLNTLRCLPGDNGETVPVVLMGDINVAPDYRDVSNAMKMSKGAGFTPEERASLGAWMKKHGWVDIWRLQHPKDVVYSWRGKTEARFFEKPAYGMRLDNFLVPLDFVPFVKDSFILTDWSAPTDHVPIGMSIDL